MDDRVDNNRLTLFSVCNDRSVLPRELVRSRRDRVRLKYERTRSVHGAEGAPRPMFSPAMAPDPELLGETRSRYTVLWARRRDFCDTRRRNSTSGARRLKFVPQWRICHIVMHSHHMVLCAQAWIVMMPVENAESSIAERLNRECRCIGTDVPALHRWLEGDLASRGLTRPIVATNPHLFSDLPVFISTGHVRQMQRVVDAVEAVARLPEYRESVLSRAPAIAQAAPATRGVFMGYDFHVSQSGPMLIEINTNAGGALLNVAMRRAQHACCPQVADYLRLRPSADQLEDQLFEMFVHEWRLSRGDRPLGRIAIVDDDPSNQYLLPEFLLFQQLFETRGVPAVVAAADQLSCDRGSLWHDGERIDMVYNRLTDFYFSDVSAHGALAQAYAADMAVITPHPHAHAIYSDKRNLMQLTDEAELRAMGVGGGTIDILLRHIPRTVCPRGDEEQWWADRKRWFFKPAQGFGSRGSYRGDKITRRVFAEVMKNDYVAQAFTPPSERSRGSEADRAVFKLDVRNYVYDGKTQLIAARLYQGQTTNFRTTGGGFAPVYLVPTHHEVSDQGCNFGADSNAPTDRSVA